ncbi:MAG: hypothetical protein DHS20C18_13090 [Saprospiraceae bacterium]|nr:MAG: hypothetical protein DHS20C18_13090 [Saprospiraceae bacterium]
MNELKYIYIDGDNIGLLIEKSFLDNNEKRIKEINRTVKEVVMEITKYLTIKDHEIIFSGADGIISKGINLDAISLMRYIRGLNNDITFSVGIGENLNNSYVALRYAKSNNKNTAVELKDNTFTILEKNNAT